MAKVEKYEGQFKQFGARKGRLMDAVLSEVKGHKAQENSDRQIADRLVSGKKVTWDKPNPIAVRNALDVLTALGKVAKYPIGGNFAIYEAKA